MKPCGNILRPLLALFLAAAAGCDRSEAPAVHHYLAPPPALQNIQRVALIDLASELHPQIAQDMSEALFRSLQNKNIFHLVRIQRTDPACREILPPSQRYTLEQLSQLRESLDCDAILCGNIRTFESYPHMQIGLYLYLLDLREGKMVWAVDNLWDVRDKTTESRIKNFFENQLGQGYEPVQWRLGLLSPATFEKFVAFEVAKTLPNR